MPETMPEPVVPATPAAPGDPAANPVERTYTEAEHKALVEDAISRRFKKYADYDELKTKAAEADQLKAAQMTDTEKAKAEAEALRAENATLAGTIKARETEALKQRIASELKVPEGLVPFLTGDTEEEMRANAQTILAAIQAQSTGAAPAPTSTDPAKAVEVDPFLAGLYEGLPRKK